MKILIFAFLTSFFLPASTIFADEPEYADFYTGKAGASNRGVHWVQAITVRSPAYCSNIKRDVTVNFGAPGMTKVEALYWKHD